MPPCSRLTQAVTQSYPSPDSKKSITEIPNEKSEIPVLVPRPEAHLASSAVKPIVLDASEITHDDSYYGPNSTPRVLMVTEEGVKVSTFLWGHYRFNKNFQLTTSYGAQLEAIADTNILARAASRFGEAYRGWFLSTKLLGPIAFVAGANNLLNALPDSRVGNIEISFMGLETGMLGFASYDAYSRFYSPHHALKKFVLAGVISAGRRVWVDEFNPDANDAVKRASKAELTAEVGASLIARGMSRGVIGTKAGFLGFTAMTAFSIAANVKRLDAITRIGSHELHELIVEHIDLKHSLAVTSNATKQVELYRKIEVLETRIKEHIVLLEEGQHSRHRDLYWDDDFSEEFMKTLWERKSPRGIPYLVEWDLAHDSNNSPFLTPIYRGFNQANWYHSESEGKWHVLLAWLRSGGDPSSIFLTDTLKKADWNPKEWDWFRNEWNQYSADYSEKYLKTEPRKLPLLPSSQELLAIKKRDN